MLEEEIIYRIRKTLVHEPTGAQQQALNCFAAFLHNRDPRAVMIMRGAAGTGKTTLAAAVVKAMAQLQQKMVLLAPTGRAAKVFSLYAGYPAYTIHRRIYRQRSAGDMTVFNLNDNLHRDTLFIIDEASMISDDSPTGSYTFGSGSLLDDLVDYVYSGQRCRMLLIGDQAQLPPVGETESPALSETILKGYGLAVHEANLTEVLRQSESSGILYNATKVRRLVESGAMGELPRLEFRSFADIVAVPGDELIESLAGSYSRVGVDETIVVTRSNKRANIYNQGIRRSVLDFEDELNRGDQLMIVKNNYHVTLPESDNANGNNFLANGDCCVVQRVRNLQALYGFRFLDAIVTFPDYDDLEVSVKLLLDTLTAEAPALSREQQNQLFQNVLEEYSDITPRSERIKALKSDAYFNAIQVKYGYAVTCHKAQGGQWAHVYIDQGYITDEMVDADYYHWLYTALTRATEKVFLVNWKVL